MKNVWVVNERYHQYNNAERYGALHPLTQGKVNIFRIDSLIAELTDKLNKLARKEDYILISGYALINALAIHYFLTRFGTARTLVWGANEQDYTVVTVNAF